MKTTEQLPYVETVIGPFTLKLQGDKIIDDGGRVGQWIYPRTTAHALRQFNDFTDRYRRLVAR